MTDVIFKNTRFDPDLTPFHNLAKQIAKAFGYTADLDFDKNLAQLIRLRVAQYNQCSYCLGSGPINFGIHELKQL